MPGQAPQRPVKASRRTPRTGRATVSVEPPDPSLRREELEVRPVSGGAVLIAAVRAAPAALIAAAAIALQARNSPTTAVITAVIAVPLLGVAIMLLKRGVKIDRLYMTPTAVGEVSPLTGRAHEVERAAIAQVVDVVVLPIAPGTFHYVLLVDADGRSRLRVDATHYSDSALSEFVRALAVPYQDVGGMKAKAVYRQWPGSIPWILGRAGLAGVITTLVVLIAIIVGLAIFGGSTT